MPPLRLPQVWRVCLADLHKSLKTQGPRTDCATATFHRAALPQVLHVSVLVSDSVFHFVLQVQLCCALQDAHHLFCCAVTPTRMIVCPVTTAAAAPPGALSAAEPSAAPLSATDRNSSLLPSPAQVTPCMSVLNSLMERVCLLSLRPSYRIFDHPAILCLHSFTPIHGHRVLGWV